jgi:hypothetical protein
LDAQALVLGVVAVWADEPVRAGMIGFALAIVLGYGAAVVVVDVLFVAVVFFLDVMVSVWAFIVVTWNGGWAGVAIAIVVAIVVAIAVLVWIRIMSVRLWFLMLW